MSPLDSAADNTRPSVSTSPVVERLTRWLATADRLHLETAYAAVEDIRGVLAEVKRLRAALETVHRYDDGLRASNWPGLANVVAEALASGDKTSREGVAE